MSFLTIQQQQLNFDSVILIYKLPHCTHTHYNQH